MPASSPECGSLHPFQFGVFVARTGQKILPCIARTIFAASVLCLESIHQKTGRAGLRCVLLSNPLFQDKHSTFDWVQGRRPQGHRRRPAGTFCAGRVDGPPPASLFHHLSCSPHVSVSSPARPPSARQPARRWSTGELLSTKYGEEYRESETV